MNNMKQKEKEITPDEMAEQLLREIDGWFITSETQSKAFDYCMEMVKESKSDEEREFWDEVSACVYTYGMDFN